MRIESQRPYGLPNVNSEAKDQVNNRPGPAPEKTRNAAGDEFELSPKQMFTRSIVDAASGAGTTSEMSAERLAKLRANVSTGYYLTEGAAEETADAVANFHR